MSTPPDDLSGRLRDSVRSFADRAREDADTAHAALLAALADGDAAPDGARLAEARRPVHRLAGGGESMGFPEISALAGPLEGLLDRIAAGEAGAIARDQAQIYARALSERCREQDLDAALERLMAAFTPPVPDPGPEDAPPAAVALVMADGAQAGRLTAMLEGSGLPALAVDGAEALARVMADRRLRPVVVDTDHPDGAEVVLGAGATSGLPLVVVSEREDMAGRLAAVRAGAVAYQVKPLDESRLVERLETLDRRESPVPFRVLVVDDDAACAELYAATLAAAGMTVESVTDPLQALDPVVHMQPEVVLLDLHMPGATGWEVARVLRQEDAMADVPIIFLSTEEPMGRQVAAVARGGDGYLEKPLAPEHLRMAVESRARRGRALARLIESAREAMGEVAVGYGDPELVSRDRCLAVDGGESLSVAGRTLHVLDAPGHAPHQHVLHDPANDAVFTADAAGIYVPAIDAVRETSPPPQFDVHQCLDDVSMIQSLDPDTLCFAHFGPRAYDEGMLDGYKRTLVEWVQAVREQRANQPDDEAVIDHFVTNTELTEIWGTEKGWAETRLNVRGVLSALDQGRVDVD